MPDITSYLPVEPRTRADERKQQAEKPSFVEAVGAAARSEWAESWALRQIDRARYDADPNFQVTEEVAKELTRGLPPEYWSAFAGAPSMDAAMKQREQLLKTVKDRDSLATLGWKGTALRIGAAILDPVDIAVGTAVGAMTGGFGITAELASKVGTVRRLVGAGLAGIAAATPVQAYLSSQDPEQDGYDVLYAALGGAVFSGLGASIELRRAAALGRRDIEASRAGTVPSHAMGASRPGEFVNGSDLIKNAGLSPEGQLYFNPHIDGERQKAMIEHLIKTSALDSETDAATIAELRAMNPNEALNALAPESVRDAVAGVKPTIEKPKVPVAEGETPPPEPPKDLRRAGDFFEERASEAPAIWRKVRHSFASILGDPEFDGSSIKFFASQAEDALPRANGAPSQIAATVAQKRAYNRIVAEASVGMDAEFRQWRRANPKATRAEFNEQVGRVLRHPPDTFSEGPVTKAAAHARKGIDEAFNFAKRHGLPGFDELEAGASYFPRIWSASAITKAQKLFGHDAVESLLAEAVTRSGVINDPEVAKKVGKGMLKTILDPDRLTDTEKGMISQGIRADLMEEVLRDAGIKDPDQIADILYGLTPKEKEAGTISRAKHRVVLDESTRIDTDKGSFGIADLFDNDVERVLHGYTHQLTGAAVAHRTYQLTAKGPEDIVTTWEQAERRLRAQLREKGVGEKKIEKALKLSRILDRSVRGLPMDETFSAENRAWLRRVRGFNHIALSGGFGWAQIPETAQIVGEAGATAVLNQMPLLTSIFSRVRETGQMSDPLLASIEQVFGTGVERVMARFSDPLEDAAGTLEMAGRRGDRMLHSVQKIANDASGAAAITMASQRFATAAAIQSLYQWAKRDAKLGLDKLATMGLSEADFATLKKAIATEAELGRGVVVEKGPLLGRRVADFQVHKWADQDAAALFIDTVEKWTQQIIQKPDLGNLPPWMATDIGKVLFQFKSFAFTAWEKQFLRGVKAHDARTFAAFGLTTAMAGLVYAARTYVNSVGRPDQSEILRNRLSLKSIAAASFQNAGYSSILPTVIESFNRNTGGPPIFTARYTGLETAISLDNNPTISNLNALWRLSGDALAPVLPWSDSETFTQKEALQAARLIPFRNLVGIKNLIDAIIQRLPESEN